MLTDTHCHLFYDDLKNDLKGVLDRANKLGVTRFICVGTNIEDSRECLSIAEENKNIFSSTGIHPHDAKEQMKVARELKRPIIFHNREADKDLIQILSEYPDVIGVAHCFSSNLDTARAFLDMGYYISFSGNITFKNSHLPSVAKEIPINRLLVETDSPYLSPVPHRGKPNEPGRTRFVAEKLADIYNLSLEDIAQQTSNNATELFHLP